MKILPLLFYPIFSVKKKVNFLLPALAALVFSQLLTRAQTRLVVDAQAHIGIVNKMAFSSNGNYLISVSDDKTIRVWNVRTGELDRTLRPFAGQGAEGAIYAMALSPDNRFVAIGGYFAQNEIRIIDLKKTAPVVLLTGHQNVITDLAFSANGLKLASSDANGLVKLWDISYANGHIQGQLATNLSGHTAQVYAISFSPDGKQLVSAGYDGVVKLWNLAGRSQSIDMKMHMDKVTACIFSSDGKFIISAGNKGKVILWDNRGAFVGYLASINEPVSALQVRNNHLLVGAHQGYWIPWPNAQTPQEVPVPFKGVSAVAIGPQQVGALAGGPSGTIVLYNLQTNEPLKLFRSVSGLPTQVAFINKNTLVFKTTKNAFTTGFDLEELKFVWRVPKQNAYQVDVHEDGGYKLQKIDAYTLSTGFSGSVAMQKELDGRVRSYSILNDKTIAVGGDFSLKLYSRKGKFIRALAGINGAVTSIGAYQNKVVAVCSDQTIKIWNKDSGELLASLFLTNKQDWIIWTPQGFYQASSGGEKFVGWQQNETPQALAKFYKSSVFAEKFHKPATVVETLRMGSFTMVKEKLKTQEGTPEKLVSLAPEKIVKEAPQVEWVTPELLETTLNKTKITVKAIIRSSSKVKLVKIMVNGRPASNTRGVVVPKSVGEFDMMVEQELVLANDINEVRIFVANQDAKKVSEKRIIYVEGVDSRSEGRSLQVINYSDRPDLYILSIGISEYANAEYNLNYADNDAQSISEVFTSLGTKVYKDVKTSVLLNAKANKQAILNAFASLTKKVQAKDMVLVFIASHGINEKGHFFILPHDADLIQKPENVVSWEDITSALSQLPAKVLLMVDACRSGQLGANFSQYQANNTEAIRLATSDENGLVFMAAATGSESALETPDWKHGAFTLALLEGIKNGKADIKPDGTIYLRELDFYVSERTIELTNDTQHPTTQKPATISRLSVMNLNK